MNNSQPRYKFYVTLLDAFTWYLESESETAFQEFIDKVNRVPFESEAAAKGTAFNTLIDSITQNGYDQLGEEVVLFDGFSFKRHIVDEFSEYFKEAIPQYKTEAILPTRYGNVLLYGYVDEILPGTAYDIKTTGSYVFPKFIHNWQHKAYPYCLREQGSPVDSFEYTITDFNNTFQESYIPNHEKDKKELQVICERLIEFLNGHRDKITDKKVFALDNVVIAEYDNDLNATIVS